MAVVDTERFFKKVCRLCDTNEHHTTGKNGTIADCTYWLERNDTEPPHIKGYVTFKGESHEFWVPVFKCPWCGKEL